jgi:hypothetical protein
MIPSITLKSMMQQTSYGFKASQELMDKLAEAGFMECTALGGFQCSPIQGKFSSGRIYYFKKHGDCTICFLKDGRVHVLSGPISMWQLHDNLSEDELSVLLAFCDMPEDSQSFFRKHMAPICSSYKDVLNALPTFQAEWVNHFRKAFAQMMYSAA